MRRDRAMLAKATGLDPKAVAPWAGYLRGNMSDRYWISGLLIVVTSAIWMALMAGLTPLTPTAPMQHLFDAIDHLSGSNANAESIAKIASLVIIFVIIPLGIALGISEWLWHGPYRRELESRINLPRCFSCSYDLSHLAQDPAPFIRCTECGEWTPKRIGSGEHQVDRQGQ